MTDPETVRIDGCELLFTLPPLAGRVIGLQHYRGKLIVATESGGVYEWDGEVKQLRHLVWLS